MKFLSTSILLPVVACFSSSARADLIVDIQDASFSAGGLGFVDVLISSTGSDNLGRFSGKFSIVQKSGGGILEFQQSFTSVSVDRQSESERADGNYAFAGNLGVGFVSNRLDGQHLLQGDRASANVTIDSTTRLLARLELQHVLPANTNVGGVYEIALVNDAFTRFQLLDNTLVPIAAQSFATSSSNAINGTSFSNFGTITVSAIPEPSSWFLLLGLVVTIASRRRSQVGRHCRRDRNETCALAP